MDHPMLQFVQRALPECHPGTVKEIITLCRLQADPRGCPINVQWQFPILLSETPIRFQELRLQYSRYNNLPNVPEEITMQDILSVLLHFILQGPISAGLLLSFVITVGPPVQEIKRLFRESCYKEMRVMEECTRREAEVNWRVFFDGDLRDVPISGMRPNPVAMGFIRYSLLKWKSSMEGTVLYPRVNRKHLSRSTDRALQGIRAELFQREEVMEQTEHISSVDVERMLWEEGISIMGTTCEMRQRWPISDSKPRTYYSSGSQQLYASYQLQEVFRSLEDVLIVGERRNRVTPSRLEVDQESVLIYDFTSFTSNFYEQRHLLLEIAQFVDGVMVLALDAVHKCHVEISLGYLIRQYIAEVNDNPEYSMERISWLSDTFGDNLTRSHGPAGFLGVHGNLASCSIGHALFLLSTIDHPNKGNSAGDDGIRINDDVEYFLQYSTPIGELQRDKVFILDREEERALHLKRPITLRDDLLILEFMTIWLHMGIVSGKLESDPRYPRSQPMSFRDRQYLTAVCVTRILSTMYRRRYAGISPSEYATCHDMLRRLYYSMKLPFTGNLPALGPETFVVPPFSDDYSMFEEDPFRRTIRLLYDGSDIQVPDYEYPVDDWVDWTGCSSEWFVVKPDSRIGYLTRVGAVEKEDLFIKTSGSDGYDFLEKVYASQYVAPVKIRVLEDVSEIR